jgi:SAM-dependent methyltransferase
MTSAWLAFWDTPHPIYVNARHKDVHYRQIAQSIAGLVPHPSAHVLDYGSGEALHADLIAAKAEEVLLCEGAPKLRAGLAARFAGLERLRVIRPEDVRHLPERSLDLIVMHSVAQYLTAEETAPLFALFGRLLKPDGTLVVSDVIPPNISATTDALALLRYGANNGFMLPAAVGLFRTRFSNYWRLRTQFGLTRYDADAMIATLNRAGLEAEKLPGNIGHNQARMAFLARPARLPG